MPTNADGKVRRARFAFHVKFFQRAAVLPGRTQDAAHAFEFSEVRPVKSVFRGQRDVSGFVGIPRAKFSPSVNVARRRVDCELCSEVCCLVEANPQHHEAVDVVFVRVFRRVFRKHDHDCVVAVDSIDEDGKFFVFFQFMRGLPSSFFGGIVMVMARRRMRLMRHGRFNSSANGSFSPEFLDCEERRDVRAALAGGAPARCRGMLTLGQIETSKSFRSTSLWKRSCNISMADWRRPGPHRCTAHREPRSNNEKNQKRDEHVAPSE